MSKARTLADIVAAGSPLVDGTIETTDITNVTASATELNYTDGVTSNIQTQMDTKAPLASPTFTGTAVIPTASVTTLNLGGTAITATATELNYVDGVTSAVQTQIDTKAPTASPTFTGTVDLDKLTVNTAAGTAGQVLTSGGTGVAPSWADAGSSVDFQEFTSSGTWTKPSGVSVVKVEVWSAGGGGGSSGGAGGSGTNSGGGGGGGGGGYLVRYYDASDLGATETVTVGAGGAGAAGGSSRVGLDGSDGGNSTFGSHVVVKGGLAGGGATTGSGSAGTGSNITTYTMSQVGLNTFNVASINKPIYFNGGQKATPGGYGGGGGGDGVDATSNATFRGGASFFAGAGGGGGGGWFQSWGDGEDGGNTAFFDGAGIGGGNNVAGTNGSGWGCGGGGGGYSSNSTGKNGGNGAVPGGGGGGGGSGTANGGAGGNGADGLVRVTSW